MVKFHVSLIKKINDSYDIEIGKDLFDSLLLDLENEILGKVNYYAIITDTNVKKFYVDKFIEKFKAKNLGKIFCYYFPAGEKSKTRQTKIRIEDEMFADGFGRDSAIIAIGGGVVTDLAGFLAGTFCRGIPFLNYATTLLAAADASIGGKTAVDTLMATNLIGLFNQPRKVYIDLATWCTLPSREVSSGLAETIKHACLASNDLFIYLEKNLNRIITQDGQLILDNEVIEYISYQNCQIKYNIVSQDEREINLRQILNLGHTGGRAIETLCGYRYLHGECVSIGLAFQAFIGLKKNLLNKEEFERIIFLLKSCCLPVEMPQEFSDLEFVSKMHTDKKVRDNSINFVLQRGIGQMYHSNGKYGITFSDEELIDLVNCYRNY